MGDASLKRPLQHAPQKRRGDGDRAGRTRLPRLLPAAYSSEQALTRAGQTVAGDSAAAAAAANPYGASVCRTGDAGRRARGSRSPFRSRSTIEAAEPGRSLRWGRTTPPHPARGGAKREEFQSCAAARCAAPDLRIGESNWRDAALARGAACCDRREVFLQRSVNEHVSSKMTGPVAFHGGYYDIAETLT